MPTTPRCHSLVVRCASLMLIGAMLLVTPAVLPLGPAAAKGDERAPAAELYVTDGSHEAVLLPLEATTLAPAAERPAVALGNLLAESGVAPVLSADGSTLALLERDGAIVVRDGLAGPERLRLNPEGEVAALTLSRDGGRVVVESVRGHPDGNPRLVEWTVFETATGKVLATVERDLAAVQWLRVRVDAEAQRLYQLTIPSSLTPVTDVHEPRSVEVIAHDLTTGGELSRLALPAVRAGTWQSDEVVTIGGSEERLMATLEPAMALSPDGRRLAIVHADAAALTVVDTARLAVERTMPVARPQGWLARLTDALSLAPREASAKGMAAGTGLEAVFAPDGRRLYVTGFEAGVEDGAPTYRGLGVRALDVATGEVLAEALEGAPIGWVMPSPDGGSLYLFGDETAEMDNAGIEPAAGYVLRRLDADSLAVLAERAFPEWRRFVVRPALAAPDLPLAVELVEMEVLPEIITLPADTKVQLAVTNHGAVAHNFTTEDPAGQFDVSVNLAPGETATVTLRAPAGEYKMFCAVAGHPQAGMGGILIAR